ncbi:MAG: FAD-dependent oxidoreductase [Cytophagaceae bacterium]|nr:FAD-dependent oxidoreductase [Gemmatimonadaceae bacterium]
MAKPVILAVDDDREVLSAVERDLRQRYRQAYRVVSATSGEQALETAREFKRRGAAIALFLIDQRMPGLSGTALLGELRTLYPETKRALLTAYADTEAAIAAINDVGLDYYFMKPWDPPEDRLYPVVDDLLADWSAHAVLPFEGLRVVGSRWSPGSFATRDFLSRNQVPYQWVDLDVDPEMRALIMGEGTEAPRLPVVLFPDGTSMVAPSNPELATRIGMQTVAGRPFYDLVIIGAGPAGLACAVYGASEGLKTLLIEQNAPGGQAGTSSMIENYLGFPNGVTGADLARRAATQAKRFGAEVLISNAVTGLRREDPYRIVELANGTEVACHALMLSSGMAAVKELEVPGVAALLGAGVYYGAALSEASMYRGQHVYVLGGANSAGQGALFFSRYASHVTLIVRKPDLSPQMSQYLIDRILQTENISVIGDSEVTAVHGEGHLERMDLRNAETGVTTSIPAVALFIFIGVLPRTECFRPLVATDDKGFILTGIDAREAARGWGLAREPMMFETNVPGIFAAGDVRANANRRIAAAVGEGSAAIFSVHQYLKSV